MIMKATEIRIERTSSYGHYRVTGVVEGREVSCITTNSEAFDYLNDDEDAEKQAEAQAHCQMILELTYENL
jgi:hypothetical protein